MKKIKKESTVVILILVLIMLIASFTGFMVYKYFQEPKEKPNFFGSIEDILISDDGLKAYIKLKIQEDQEIINLSFIFSDFEKQCGYTINELKSSIEVPLSKSFLEWLFGKPPKTEFYDYEISIGEVDCFDNFYNVENISLVVTYEEKSELQNITVIGTNNTIVNNTKNTTRISEGGGGGGGGGCIGSCDGKECGNNGCGGSCRECSKNQICENYKCVEIICSNSDDCEENYYCNNGTCFENTYCGGIICNNGYCDSFENCVEPICNMEISDNFTNLSLTEDFECPLTEVIYLSGENITIDCRGHKIIPIFITNTSGYNNIRNCEIEGKLFSDEMGFLRTGAIYVQDRRDYGGSYAGVWRYNTFENNILYGGGSCISEICCNYGDTIVNNTFFNCTIAIGDDEGAHLRIYNNTFRDSVYGIFSGSRKSAGKNSIIIGNEFYNNFIAIMQDNIFHIISNNYFHDNHAALVANDNIEIGSPSLSYGFTNNTITGNIFENNSLSFFYQTPGNYLNQYGGHNIIESYCRTEVWPDCYINDITNNLINGKPLYYWYDEHNKVIENIELGYFSCAHCSDITLENVKINEPNAYGVFLFNSTNIQIKNSEISKSEYCVFFANSSGNLIENTSLDCYVNVSELDSSDNVFIEEVPSLSLWDWLISWFKRIF